MQVNRVARQLLQIPLIRLEKFHHLLARTSSPTTSSTSPSALLQLKHLITCQCANLATRIDKMDEGALNTILAKREFKDVTIDHFEELIQSDQDREQIEEILSLYEIEKYQGGLVPSTITVDRMKELLTVEPDKRGSFFLTLLGKEVDKAARKLYPKEDRVYDYVIDEFRPSKRKDDQVMGVKFDPQTGAPIYGEWLNAHFLQIKKSQYTHSFDSKTLMSSMFGQKLIIDCDYELSFLQARSVGFDLKSALHCNRLLDEPYDINFCGLKSESVKEQFSKVLSGYDPQLGFLGLKQCKETILDLYPKSKIIYLTPFAEACLEKYDDKAVYVLGGLPIYDEERNRSWNKCNRLKITSRRFPLESYFVFKSGKSLSLKECIKIMGHFKESRDLHAALKYGIDKHRIKTEQEVKEDYKIRTKRFVGTKKSFERKPGTFRKITQSMQGKASHHLDDSSSDGSSRDVCDIVLKNVFR